MTLTFGLRDSMSEISCCSCFVFFCSLGARIEETRQVLILKVIFLLKGGGAESWATYQYWMEIDAVQVEPFDAIQITHFGHSWNESPVHIAFVQVIEIQEKNKQINRSPNKKTVSKKQKQKQNKTKTNSFLCTRCITVSWNSRSFIYYDWFCFAYVIQVFP